MMLEMQQEAFSRAFAQAVCSVTGFVSSQPVPDVDSVDWCVHGRIDERTTQGDIQLKCLRGGAIDPESVDFSYELDHLKSYEDMLEPERLTPLILVVVRVPTDLSEGIFSPTRLHDVVFTRVAPSQTPRAASSTLAIDRDATRCLLDARDGSRRQR
jgi:hypothetical protein